MNATETMERQPRSKGSDVAITFTYHGPKGDKISKYTKRQCANFLAIVLGFYGFLAIGISAMSDWATKYETDARRSAMEKLADAGKDQAALWMVQHYPLESRDRLPALVSKGYAEALFYQGLLMRRDKGNNVATQESGLQLIQRAADQGYWPAIRFIERNALSQ